MERQPGQGGDADPQVRDLRAQLLEAEATHFQKTSSSAAKPIEKTTSNKRQLEDGHGTDGEEDIASKRRRILEETRDIDADSDGSESESSSDDSDEEEEDETAELLRELEKIKRERAEQKEKEVINSTTHPCMVGPLTPCDQEREKAELEQEKREKDIALGNPLLMPTRDTEAKRRYNVYSLWSRPSVFTSFLGGTTMSYSGIRREAQKTRARRNLSTCVSTAGSSPYGCTNPCFYRIYFAQISTNASW